MVSKISFQEFKKGMEEKTLPFSLLENYLEYDSDSPVVKLKFREGAFQDTPPASYDVDNEVYLYQRHLREEEEEAIRIFGIQADKHVVAEGDSWFNLPTIFKIRPPAIADWIGKNGRYEMNNIARWGHTLEEILQQNEYLDAIAGKNQADYFMLCGGGNDLQDKLKNGGIIHPFDPARPVDEYLTNNGTNLMEFIEFGLDKIVEDVNREFPNIPILLHGYDFPRPHVGGGRYIGKHLRNLGFPEDRMLPVLKVILNQINDSILRIVGRRQNTKLVDCRDKTSGFQWIDDMHPSGEGFHALAQLFENHMPR